MTGLVDVNGAAIPPAVKGREIWRCKRPSRPGFRPEEWALLEVEEGVFQFARTIRGRQVAATPPASLWDAGDIAQQLVAGDAPPSPGALMMLATVLSALHALAMTPEPDGGGATGVGAQPDQDKKDAA